MKNPVGLKCAQTRALFDSNCNFSGHFACVFSPYLHLCMFSKGWIHETFRQTAMFLHIFLIFFSISCVFLILKKPPSTCGKIQSSRDGFKLDHHLTETAMFFDQIMSRFEKDFHVFFIFSCDFSRGTIFWSFPPPVKTQLGSNGFKLDHTWTEALTCFHHPDYYFIGPLKLFIQVFEIWSI